MSLKKVFKLVSINPIKYSTGEGKTEYRKECHLKRYERSSFSGKMVPATMNSSATVSFFPHRFNRQGELVDNDIYKNLSEYLDEQLFVTTKRFTTSPFNYAGDDENAEPREQVTATVTYEESDTDATIQQRLINQALYQLRGLGVEIFEDGAKLGTSASENEWNERKEAAQAKTEALRAKNPTTNSEAPQQFNAKDVEAAFVKENPEATEDEIAEYVLTAEEEFLKAQGAGVNGA